jgi:hypothetical protein
MAYYNIRDLIGHWVAPRSAKGKMCPHACCRGYRVHPGNYPVILPNKLLRRASDFDLADHYDQVTRGHTAADRRAELQIIHEMERRDRAAEEARRHHEAVLLARAGRRAEREAEYERIKRAAEAATQGYLVNRQGRARGINDHEILTGRQAIFDRYASEEARNYFLDHPRPTAAYFRGQDTRVTGRYAERKRQARRPPSYRSIKIGKGRTVNVAVVSKRDRAGQRPAIR